MATSNAPQSGLHCCSVCYQEYSEEEERTPRVLQCGHTFCTGCLAKVQANDSLALVPELSSSSTTGGLPTPLFEIVSSTRSRELKCPGCKQPHPRTQSIPKNFQLLALQQLPGGSSSTFILYVCEEHQKEKDVFCKDDNVVVCPFCALYGEHRTHDTVPAAEICKPIKDTLRSDGEKLATYLAGVSKAYSEIQQLMYKLEEDKNACWEKMSLAVEQVCTELHRRKDKELSELNQFCLEQVGILKDQLSVLEETKKDCEEQLRSCRSLARASPAAVVTEHKVVIATTEQLCSQIADQPLKPVVTPAIKSPKPPPLSSLVDPLWARIEALYGSNEEEKMKDREKREDGNLNVRPGGRVLRSHPALKDNTRPARSLPAEVALNDQVAHADPTQHMAAMNTSPTTQPPGGLDPSDTYDEAQDNDIFT